ncbi:DUF418 domain-containing protein [Aquipuribacter sp. SD81]|uniref:DUF418 domain-containing protein n=1 Tax=Aquipuribacter sp. SD81 TaxID=3127703 RepID=UPI003016E515
MSVPASPPRPGPVETRDRLLAPDLARGVALLGIALANCVVWLPGRDIGPLGKPVDGSAADRAVDTVVGLLVDNRAFPMFTLLFAYGFVLLLRRMAAQQLPWPEARAVLLRRSLWLAVFGAAHMLLLFFGDILLSYGLLGLMLVWVVRWSDARLKVLGWSCLVALAGLSALDGLGGALDQDLPGPLRQGTVVGDAVWRLLTLVSTVSTAPFVVAALVPPAVVGILLARRRVLERPQEHLPLLRRLVLVGFPVSVLGAVPLVLAATGAVDLATGWDLLLATVHGLSGLVGAVAFVAAVAWWAGRRPAGPRPGGLPGALVAVGRRSLTCYLLQSVLFTVLLPPWALGLADGAGTATVSTVAVGVYVVTLVVAVVLERAGDPGPAERLLRRLTYGSRRSAGGDGTAPVRP